MKAKDVEFQDVRLGHEHEQLPNVEEVRTTHVVRHDVCSKKRHIVGLAGILLLIIAITVLGVSVQSKNRKQQNSVATDSDRLELVVEFLGQHSDSDALDDPNSAQFKAARWMALEDAKQLPLFPIVSHRFLQRYALATIYFSTGGENWLYDLNFASPKRDECHWNHKFRQSHGASYDLGVGCDSDNQVTSVVIDAMGLVGTLPPELSLLTNLQLLSLHSNSLSGAIPNLHAMNKLEWLTLTANNFSTKLPTWLGNLRSLVALGLSSNNFIGTIPTEFQSMTSLKTLVLDDNVLSGNLNVIEQMTWLESLYLQSNHFTGTLANDFLGGLKGLEVLNLSNNLLKGKLPRGLFRQTALTVLNLADNSLTGNIPGNVPMSTTLKILAIQDNQMTGTIPPSIQNLVNLQQLDVSSNQMHGDIPTILGSLSKMISLSLSDNDFIAAAIPPFLRSMPLLRELSLRNTGLIGKIPPWVGLDFSSLVFLDFDNNALTGSVPTQVASLQKLEYLFLSRNALTGTLPLKMPEMLNLCKLKPDHQ